MNKLFRYCIAVLLITSPVCSLAQQPAFKVDVRGKGEPILLFPGFACTGEVWEATTKELSSKYECHVFTFAGFGEVAPIGQPWLPAIKDELIRYVKEKKLKNATIIGHSLGGTLGLWLATEEKELFKKLIAVDALPCTGALMVPNYNPATMVYDNPYSKQMLEMDSSAFRKMALQSASFMMLNKSRLDQVVDWMVKADRKTYVYGYIDLLKLDLREDIAKINIPVVILAATHPDKNMIEKTYNSQYGKLSNKRILYADKSAHFIMYDQPEWLLASIMKNLQ